MKFRKVTAELIIYNAINDDLNAVLEHILRLKKKICFQFIDKITLTPYNARRSVISAAR